MVFFTADLHLGHANVIRHCNRPFASAEEMDEALIRNWNGAVKQNDEIYILGDFTMLHAAAAHEYLARLNGRKYFIRGNHDRFLNNFEPFASDFEWVKDYHSFKRDKRGFVLFHYPILEWDGFFRDAIHLYGHVHNSQTSQARIDAVSGLAFNVGVDVWNYRPVSIEEILRAAQAQ